MAFTAWAVVSTELVDEARDEVRTPAAVDVALALVAEADWEAV